jgi:hypothetical protein
MSAPAHDKPIAQSSPRELDALLAAISDGIAALGAWDVAAFQAAAERQSEICDRIAAHSMLPPSAEDAVMARKVRELNRVYDRLLQHSIRWACTLRTILQDDGRKPSVRVHFKG